MRDGRVFTRQEDQQGGAVAVIGYKLARELFPDGDAVGATMMVDGHPFLIVGAVAEHAPQRPVWDIAMTGAKQDALYLPFSWWQRLLARPEFPLSQAAVGADLRRPAALADAVHQLLAGTAQPEASRQAYRAYLDRHLSGPGRPGYQLRDYAAWAANFAMPFSDIRFFTILTGLVLLGGGFNASRLLLAKGLARRSELSIHRALGASRASIFARQLAEAALLAVPAALLGILLSFPYNGLFNRLVEVNDVPVQMTADGLAARVHPFGAGGCGRRHLPGLAAGPDRAHVADAQAVAAPGRLQRTNDDRRDRSHPAQPVPPQERVRAGGGRAGLGLHGDQLPDDGLWLLPAPGRAEQRPQRERPGAGDGAAARPQRGPGGGADRPPARR